MMITKATITEILDDLRAADEITRRFERLYWLSSADFYNIYQQGLLDNGENLEDFTLWAGYHQIKLKRELEFAGLSRHRVLKLRSKAKDGFVNINSPETCPSLTL